MNRDRGAGVGAADGYLLLRKSPGPSSFETLFQVKRALGTGRVGHSGTLDSFAEGLLVVLVGRSTRLVPWFTGCDKRYQGLIRFGAETDTLDPQGKIVAEAPPPDRSTLEEILKTFRGDLLQTPPIYSSVHVGGRRAHQLARSGVEVEMPRRPVTIHSIELLSYEDGEARVDVRCSKGTYIRSLARDIALACGSRAHLRELLRLEVAGFRVEDAVDPSTGDPLAAIAAGLRRVDEAAFRAIGMPTATLPDQVLRDVAHGKPPDPSWIPTSGQTTALFSAGGLFLAIVLRVEDRLSYGYVALRPEDL